MLIAVAVDENGNTATFAGRALRWEVYSVDKSHAIKLAWSVEFSEFGSMHEWHVNFSESHQHPLHQVDIALAASAGNGVINNLKMRNTTLLTTSEKSPINAVKAYFVLREEMHVDEGDQLCLDLEKRKARELEA